MGKMIWGVDMTIQLILGDCLEVMKSIPAGSVDAIITDLPYGTTACSWDEVIPFEPMWEAVKRVLKRRGVFITTASQPFTSALVMSNPALFRYEYTWIKTKASNFQNSRIQPMKRHESVLVFYQQQPVFNLVNLKDLDKPIKNSRKNKGANLGHCKDKGNYFQTKTGFAFSDLYYPNPSGSGQLHPTQKPVALYEYLIRTYTNEGETVLDICAGSGTTGVAAVKTGRNCILIEKREDYMEIARQRIEQAQQQPLLEGI